MFAGVFVTYALQEMLCSRAFSKVYVCNHALQNTDFAMLNICIFAWPHFCTKKCKEIFMDNVLNISSPDYCALGLLTS